jgi:hypothetical protein
VSERGYRISSRRSDGSTRVGIAFSLLVNDAGTFFLPVPATHGNDGGEITINNATIGPVQMAAPGNKGELASCCGYVAVPVEPFGLPPPPNLRPPSTDSCPPVVLAQVHFGTVAGHVARTRFRYNLTNPNRTELGVLVHLTDVTETIIPLGSLCSSGLTDWGVVAAVDRGGRAVVTTPLTTVLTGFLQHGLRLATAEDMDRAYTTRFRMLPFVLPAIVGTVQAVFELADRLAGGKKPFVADASVLTFDDFMDAVECIGKYAPPVKRQDLPPGLAQYALESEVNLYDKDGPLGHLWINYADARVTLRKPGDYVPKTEVSAASILRQAKRASAA